MTKKDYILIANALAKAIIDVQDAENHLIPDDKDYKAKLVGIGKVKHYLIGNLWADNNKFSEEKFTEYILDRIEYLKN